MGRLVFSRTKTSKGADRREQDLARDSTVSNRSMVNLSGGDRKLKSKMLVLLNHRFMK